MVNIYFNQIRSQILSELENAQRSILVAVYWFTNEELFLKLLQKKEAGLDVQLIIHNDYVNNRETGLAFQTLIDAGCDLYFSDDENPMHNKFCIIDQKVLINGSYNWTYYAESKNRENVLIIKDDDKVISAFEIEFARLISVTEPLKSIRYITKFEVEKNNILANRDYLAHDLIFQAKAENKPELVKNAFEIAPENLNIQKIAEELNLVKKQILKFSIGVGLLGGGVKFIAKKGATVPATFSTIVRTTKDNQTKTITDIVYGQYLVAAQNKKLTKMILNGIPPKPKGEAEIQFTFSIDINGNVLIEKMSLDNGVKEIYNTNSDWLIE